MTSSLCFIPRLPRASLCRSRRQSIERGYSRRQAGENSSAGRTPARAGTSAKREASHRRGKGMIAFVDVDYRDDEAAAACVLSAGWADEILAREIVERVRGVEPYVPGQFYKRELPCLLAVLA